MLTHGLNAGARRVHLRSGWLVAVSWGGGGLVSGLLHGDRSIFAFEVLQYFPYVLCEQVIQAEDAKTIVEQHSNWPIASSTTSLTQALARLFLIFNVSGWLVPRIEPVVLRSAWYPMIVISRLLASPKDNRLFLVLNIVRGCSAPESAGGP